MTSVPDLLRASFLMYRANAKLFVGYASWLLLSYAAVVLATLIPHEGVRLGLGLAIEMADMVLFLLVSVIMVVLVKQIGLGKQADTNAVPLYALSVLGSFVWVVILQALTILGGLLLFIVPGVIFLVWFGLATQAMLLDGKRGLDALSVSRDLTKGRFWAAAKIQLGGPIICYAAFLMALAGIYFLIARLTGTSIGVIFGENPPLWADMLETVGNIFLLPLISIYDVLVYGEMKKDRKLETGN